MRNLRSLGMTLGLALVAYGCSIRMQAGRANAPPANAPPANAPPIHLQPVNAPPPNAPAPNQPLDPSPRAPVQATPALAETVDVQKLRAAAARPGCGFLEIRPQVFVHLDCAPYTPLTKAKPLYSPAKLRSLLGPAGRFAVQRPVPSPQPSSRFGRFGRALPVPGQQPWSTKPGTAPSTPPAPTTPPPAPTTPTTPPPPTPPAPTPPSPPPDTPPPSREQIIEVLSNFDQREFGLVGPIKSQGTVGACTAFALSSSIDNALRRAGRSGTVSPQHVWAGYGLPNMREAGDSNVGRDLATWETLPYSQPDACRLARGRNEECEEVLGIPQNTWTREPRLLSALQRADRAGIVKIRSIEALSDPVNIEELLVTLNSGAEVWAAFTIDGSAWSNPARDGVIRDTTRGDGGHAVTIAGVRMVNGKRQYLIHNSWGTDWGINGFAWLQEATLIRSYRYAYRIRIENNQPGRGPTDDDCDGDELVDSVTKQCAKVCANFSRPAGGKCQ